MRTFRWILVALSSLAAIAGTSQKAFAARCANGAEVDDVARCSMVRHFRPIDAPIDFRVTAKISPDDRTAKIRSVAIIVGISRYPRLASADLDAARNDVVNLEKYLTGEGKFDEVIVLENADASKANIAYFLGDYLSDKALFYENRLRVLFAYSGHGFKGEGGRPPALALMNAVGDGSTPTADMVPMGELKGYFDNVSNNSFHFLALINACYAGTVFRLAIPGGNIDDPNRRSAYAMTASSKDDLAWAIGGEGSGSVFFEALLDGIRNGKADPLSFSMVDGTGEPVVEGGIVRLGALNTFVTTKFETWRASGLRLPDGHKLSSHWMGSILPPDNGQLSEGGFFFLSAPFVLDRFSSRFEALATAVPADGSAASFGIPARNASSIPGSPDLKVFLEPAAYEIHGVDVSSLNGRIEWNHVARNGITFAYMKATEGVRGVDSRFETNWTNAKNAGIRRGAYHSVELCKPVDGQFENITRHVPKEPGMLPVALDVEPNKKDGVYSKRSKNEPWRTKYKFDFSKRRCAVNSIEEARQALDQLASKLEAHYGTTPTIFGIVETFQQLIDARFSKYNLWLAQHKEGNFRDVGLPGNTPWTIWQYTAAGKVRGVNGKVGKNVFFGSESALLEFTRKPGNVSLQQSSQQPPR